MKMYFVVCGDKCKIFFQGRSDMKAYNSIKELLNDLSKIMDINKKHMYLIASDGDYTETDNIEKFDVSELERLVENFKKDMESAGLEFSYIEIK